MQISILISYFEHYEFYTAWRYAATYYNICLALFYSSILPISVLYCLVSTIIKYISDKYFLINRSNCKVGYSEQMSKKITSELNIFFLYFILGILFKEILVSFFKFGEFRFSLTTIFLLIISGILIFIPITKLITFIKKNIVSTNYKYTEWDKDILENYDSTNKYKNIIEEINTSYKNRNFMNIG